MKKSSLLSLLLFFGFAIAHNSLAQAPLPIVPDGRTQTTVTVNGNVTGITTNTIRGANGFNSFNTFNVGKGTTANLYLPSATNNLLNLVNGSRSTIDGILNSIKNGQIGGHVFFMNPYGMVVGSTGVINVGALTLITPTKDFMDSFFDGLGNVSDAATTAVLAGTVPLSSDGLISVQGHINAVTDIGVAADDVMNAGTISTGAVFVVTRPDFSDVVNVKGLQTGSQFAITNGNIEILAAHDVENSGTISTEGAASVNGGKINIQAGNDIRLIGNSVISSSGSGSNSNAGDITILADGNAYLIDHAQVAANGGEVSGDAGSIEFSAKGTLTIDGGNLSAAAVNGTPGHILLDPKDLVVVNSNENSAGADITLAANNSITIGCATAGCNQGSSTVTVSSQNLDSSGNSKGNSGNISLTAPQISVLDNSQILAGANAGFQAGDISLTAAASNESANADANAAITIGKATLTGNNIRLSAAATAKADSSADNQFSVSLSDSSLGFPLSGTASADISNANASVNVGNALIQAAGDVNIEADASSSAKVNLNSSQLADLAYGESNANAAVSIGSGTTITAGGAFNLNAKAENNLDVSVTAADASVASVAAAFGKATLTSTVQSDGSVTAGSITAASQIENSFSTEAKGTESLPAGGGSVAVALGFYQSSASNNVTGSMAANTGDVNISANSTNTKNSTQSESEVSDESSKSDVVSSVEGLDNLDKYLGSSSQQPNQPPAESNSNPLGLAGAVTYASSSNSANTNMSGSATALQGDINVTSMATDSPGLSAAGSASGANVSLGGALALGKFSNAADAEVSGNAVLTAQGVQVKADAEITNPITDPIHTIVSDFDFTGVDFSQPATVWAPALWNDIKGFNDGVNALENDLDNPNVFTTSYTNTGLSASDSGSNTVGLAGSVDILTLNNSATAAIKGNANVTAQSGDVEVSAAANATMINASGMAFTSDQIKDRNPGVEAGSSLGGSYLGANLTNSSTAFIGDNATVVGSAGNIKVDANTQSLAIDIFQAGDKAEKFGITGAFSVGNIADSAEAYIQSNATVNAGKDVSVNATNHLNDFSVGGALGVGGTAQVGVTVAWNQVDDTTLAYIGDLSNSRTNLCAGCGVTAGGNVNVNAQSQENLYAISFAAAKSGSSGSGADGESSSQPTGQTAPSNSGSGGQGDNGAGGGSYGFGISGDIAFNQLNDGSGGPGVNTEAFINNGANVAATAGDVNITAQDSSFVVAAGAAGALGQTAALAGAYGQNTFGKQVEAFTENSKLTAKGLNVNASTKSDLFNVTAGGGVNTEEGIALAGSVNNNAITNTPLLISAMVRSPISVPMELPYRPAKPAWWCRWPVV